MLVSGQPAFSTSGLGRAHDNFGYLAEHGLGFAGATELKDGATHDGIRGYGREPEESERQDAAAIVIETVCPLKESETALVLSEARIAALETRVACLELRNDEATGLLLVGAFHVIIVQSHSVSCNMLVCCFCRRERLR